ncbi:hypothetical protein M2336_002821 [Sphingobium sp. B1D7B]|uniref:hypothetical protein n=1 Tax=Sphingobium sp. B1D7B TaxID=2940578 RepID=UPI00222529E9|nr:hypothetical protein [Sphingobium sp. B1D7B]MCW2406192.1 hypothetical protein [Sphingobium sp. B1D7B]
MLVDQLRKAAHAAESYSDGPQRISIFFEADGFLVRGQNLDKDLRYEVTVTWKQLETSSNAILLAVEEVALILDTN